MTEEALSLFQEIHKLTAPAVSILALLALLVFGPMGFYPQTRTISLKYFVGFKWIFGCSIWLWSAYLLLQKGGIFLLVVGMFFAVLGVIPLAFLSTLLTLDIVELLRLLSMFITYMVTTLYIGYLAAKITLAHPAGQRRQARGQPSSSKVRSSIVVDVTPGDGQKTFRHPSKDFFDNLPEAERHDEEGK
ncbi:MAG: hypothetical protein ACI9YB_001854 [Halioglobus sp.]|jgi:hypothetical protein